MNWRSTTNCLSGVQRNSRVCTPTVDGARPYSTQEMTVLCGSGVRFPIYIYYIYITMYICRYMIYISVHRLHSVTQASSKGPKVISCDIWERKETDGKPHLAGSWRCNSLHSRSSGQHYSWASWVLFRV